MHNKRSNVLLEFHRGQAQVLQGDMFLPAMRDFQAQATCRLAEAEDLFQDMKTRVSENNHNFK
jgi:dishevelled associated activator of morphogenesis